MLFIRNNHITGIQVVKKIPFLKKLKMGKPPQVKNMCIIHLEMCLQMADLHMDKVRLRECINYNCSLRSDYWRILNIF